MLSVISPAKNLDFDSSIPSVRATQPLLLDEAEALACKLKGLSPQEISALMKISDKLGVLNYDRFQAWKRPFTKDTARPAIFSFNGDVYQGLAASSLDNEDLKFAQQHLHILSGLYGVLRPLDLMQAYRLEMGTKFENPKGSNLYDFWGSTVTQVLNKQINKISAKQLLNLASNEYFKSIKTKELNVPVIEPIFKDWKNGQYKIISFFAKKARGLMSNYIIKNRIVKAEDLKAFKADGYQFSTELSTDSKWVFTRKQA